MFIVSKSVPRALSCRLLGVGLSQTSRKNGDVFDRLSKDFPLDEKMGKNVDLDDDELSGGSKLRDRFRSHRRSSQKIQKAPEVVDIDAQLQDMMEFSKHTAPEFEEPPIPREYEPEKPKKFGKSILKFDVVRQKRDTEAGMDASPGTDVQSFYRVDSEQVAMVRAKEEQERRQERRAEIAREADFDAMIDPVRSFTELDRDVMEALGKYGIQASPEEARKWAGMEKTREELDEMIAAGSFEVVPPKRLMEGDIAGDMHDHAVPSVSHSSGLDPDLEATQARLRRAEGMTTVDRPEESAKAPWLWTESKSESSTSKTPRLSPSQLFFAENKDKLLERARQHFALRHSEGERLSDASSRAKQRRDLEDGWSMEEEDDDKMTPFTDSQQNTSAVARPAKGHLWAFGSKSDLPKQTVVLEAGRLPSVEELLKMLEQEHIEDVAVVDLAEAGRRDLGRYGIVGTAQTPKHARAVGQLLAKAVLKLDVPFVNPYCSVGPWHKDDDWVVAQLGPIGVHLLVKESRARLNLEEVWLHPQEHFSGSNEFPGYWDYDPSMPSDFVLRKMGRNAVQAVDVEGTSTPPEDFKYAPDEPEEDDPGFADHRGASFKAAGMR